MFRLLLASILVLTSSIATAQIEEEDCHAEEGDGLGPGGTDLGNDNLWNGDFRRLDQNGWSDAEDYNRGTDLGPIGQCNGGSGCGNATTTWQICWSLDPFTTTNTNNGETCTNEGPLEFTTSETYYRMQIDRSQTPTRYCQIAIETGAVASSDTLGDTRVVTLDANGNNSGNVPDPDGDGDDKYPGQGSGGGGGGGQGRQATPVPTMSMYLLMGLSGLLALFGFYRVRASK